MRLDQRVAAYSERVESVDLSAYYEKAKADRERMRFVARLLVTLGIACIPAVLAVVVG